MKIKNYESGSLYLICAINHIFIPLRTVINLVTFFAEF